MPETQLSTYSDLIELMSDSISQRDTHRILRGPTEARWVHKKTYGIYTVERLVLNRKEGEKDTISVCYKSWIPSSAHFVRDLHEFLELFHFAGREE